MTEPVSGNKRQMTAKRRTWRETLPILALAFFGIVWMVPLFWTLLAAFVPTTQLLNGSPLVWLQSLHLGAFAEAWEVAPFPRFYLNTVIWVFGLLALQLVTVSLAGFALARMDFRGKDQIFFLFLTQLMVPATVLILPNYQTLVTLGWLDSYQGMMAPYIASAFGTFLMRQAFKQVPKELEEAARSDGATWLQVLWHVFLPVTRAPLLAFSIVSVTYHWNEFLWPLLITSSVETRPLTVGLALLVQSSEIGAQWDLLSAGTLIVAVPVIVLLALVQKQFTNSFLSSGIK